MNTLNECPFHENDKTSSQNINTIYKNFLQVVRHKDFICPFAKQLSQKNASFLMSEKGDVNMTHIISGMQNFCKTDSSGKVVSKGMIIVDKSNIEFGQKKKSYLYAEKVYRSLLTCAEHMNYKHLHDQGNPRALDIAQDITEDIWENFRKCNEGYLMLKGKKAFVFCMSPSLIPGHPRHLFTTTIVVTWVDDIFDILDPCSSIKEDVRNKLKFMVKHMHYRIEMSKYYTESYDPITFFPNRDTLNLQDHNNFVCK